MRLSDRFRLESDEPLAAQFRALAPPPGLDSLRALRFEYTSRGDRVTGRLLLPPEPAGPRPLALVGHGAGGAKDAAYVDTLIELFQATRSRVAEAAKDGLSLEDTRKKVDLGDFKQRLAGDDLWRRRAFDDFFVQPGIERAYKEAKGEPME